uniref:CRAL-TRIO domain-containing protein n=1 Tax=Aureoumbra lagunensis TaxID=44058 RepID=A0A7S3JVI4_9STRA|mmetsp:Transcript_20799/g.26918  ORF Transcript_20799/g.26918 Transcript_20799/m.26918 type:complete len:849 (+) Transcript_20799:51-2597(+)
MNRFIAVTTWSWSFWSTLPPLGPRALLAVAEVTTPTRGFSARAGVETWAYIVVAAELGSRIGRHRWWPQRADASTRLGLIAIHLLMGCASRRWSQLCLRILASAVGAGMFAKATGEVSSGRLDAIATALGAALGAVPPLGWRLLTARFAALSATIKLRVWISLAVLALVLLLVGIFMARRQIKARCSKRNTWFARRKRQSNEIKNDDGMVPKLLMQTTPSLYVEMCGGNHETAKKRWNRTLEWRAQHNADNVLSQRQPKYHAVKQLYPHYLHGKARDGEVIMFELVGSLDTSSLRNGSLTTDDAFRHFVFVHEFISHKFQGEDTRLVSVLDVGGLRFSQVDSTLLRLLSATSNVLDNLVPFRAVRIYIINAPSWFSTVWNGAIKRALPTSVRDKVQVLKSTKALASLLGIELPREYGGTLPLGQHDFELDLLETVCLLNNNKIPKQSEIKQSEILSVQIPSDDQASSQRQLPLSNNYDSDTRSPSGFVSRLLPWRRRQGKVAHLGRDSDFYYDAVHKRWVFPGDEARRDEDSDDEDDKALVAAIRAATLHRAGALTEDDDEEDTAGLRRWLQLAAMLTRGARGVLVTSIPVWILAPASRGGVGLKIPRAAFCQMAAMLIVAILAGRTSDALAHMPQRAPLRAFRVAAGSCLLLTAAAPVTVPGLGGQTSDGMLPRDSAAVAIVATAVLATLAVAATLAVNAADASLTVARRSPIPILSLFADIAGPLLALKLLRPALDQPNTASYPFDASLGLTAAAAAYALLYLVSLSVYRQVVGDVRGTTDNVNGTTTPGSSNGLCAAFLELPARDLGRCVDDFFEDPTEIDENNGQHNDDDNTTTYASKNSQISV